MKYTLLFTFFTVCLLPGYGQRVDMDTIAGRVVNLKGNPISNALISVVGSKTFTVTNNTGVFQLVGVHLTDTLSIIVKKHRAILPVQGRKYMAIKMVDDTKFETEELGKDEVSKLVRQLRRARDTNSSIIISGEELRATGEINVLNALAGKVPGLTIIMKDNGTVSVRIRGGSSMNLDDSPLYLLDDVETDRIESVNINDVKRVEVIKDSNIYGVKGANGVIKVFTR